MRAKWAASGLSGTLDDVVAAEQKQQRRSRGDQRVCKCGHAARAHTGHHGPNNRNHDALEASGYKKCIPGRQVCPCAEFEPAISVSNAGRFMRKTSGPGSEHALSLGIRSLLADGGTFEWIEGVGCDACKRTVEQGAILVPIAFNPTTLQEQYSPSAINKLVCEDCRARRIAAGT
jgi:hypothetical protein